MNYRHTYHAGNAGDVLKHAALVLLVRSLLQKDGPLTVIDTHAGRGLYDLNATEAQKTNEADLGVRLAASSSEMALAPYLRVVSAFNPPDTLRYYPGSPAFLANTLRSTDTLVVNELHKEEAAELRSVFKGDKQVQIHQRDGYELWLAMTPTKTARGLVLVDPPYEKTDEYDRLAETLIAAHKKWAHGITAIWYPLKERPAIWRWHEKLLAAGIQKMLVIEHCLYTEERADRFNGSGLLIVNPPFAFTEEMPALLAAIKNALTLDGQKPWTKFEWLAE